MDFDIAETPQNIIIPITLTNVVMVDYDADLTILDKPDQVIRIKNIFFKNFIIFKQVYGKSLVGDGKVKFKNGNLYEGNLSNGMLHGKYLDLLNN